MKIQHPAEALTSDHEIAGFDCGRESLNRWLLDTALKAEAKRDARTYVCVDVDTGRVIGYHSLSVGSVSRAQAKGPLARNGPDPIPTIVLARLAVSEDHQGNGVGAFLLVDAFQRAVATTEIVGARAIVVNPLDEAASNYYEERGFNRLRNDPTLLFMEIESARKTLEAAGV